MPDQASKPQVAQTKSLAGSKLDTPANSATSSQPRPTTEPKSHLAFRVGAIIITVVVLSLAAFFGIQLATKTGVFHEPGKLVFDANTSELNRDFIETNLTGLELKSDVTITTSNSFSQLPAGDNHILYDILVPVTNFGSGRSSVTESEISAILDGSTIPTNCGSISQSTDAPVTNCIPTNPISLISIWNLDAAQKLLAIDNQYYLDTFNSGAVFQYYVISGSSADVSAISESLRHDIAAFPSQDTVFTFAQTGVTALSREMNTTLNRVGSGAYFAENIASFLSAFDKTHTSNESSFSTGAPSGSHTSTICSLPGMIDVLTSIGLDIVELTGNHNQDCGDQAALDTIIKYKELGIEIVGGGSTAAEAALPLQISEKGTNITMLAYNLSTGGYTLDDTPGANFYTEEKAQADIAAAKERGDFIIIDIQFNECNSYVNTSEDTTCDYADSSAPYAGHGSQSTFFRHLIDLGADIVVGTSAHQPQTFELYGDGAIYYGLGNLFFDQIWWPGTTRSLILVHYFYEGKLLQTRLVPTVYGTTYQTALMDEATATNFIDRLYGARPGN